MAARHLIEKNRARLARESGTIYKPHSGKVRFALAFPSTYYVGMSNLGFQLVYGMLNDYDDVVCERVFIPDLVDLPEMSRPASPLFTMESQCAVRDSDVLGLSLSFELDYPNVLKLLALSGIPELSDDRLNGKFPLVIAGGPAAMFNPEPLAAFIDAFIIGDAEAILPDFVETLFQHRDSTRTELLLALAHVKGVYVPRFYRPAYNTDGTISEMIATEGVPQKVSRQWVRSLDEYRCTSVIVTPDTEFSNMVLAEVARGCGRQCRFCAAGYTYLPPRARSHQAVLDGLEKSLLPDREHRVGLLSASVFDHASSLLVCEALAQQGQLFSISSTRADTLNEQVAEVLHRGGHETLTIAPEAGSDRLRGVINKCITREDILRAAQVAWDSGFKRLRLYFMVGLPTETYDDIQGIISLVTEVAEMHKWAKVSVSAGCFVPKPWTPFQWAGMDDEKELEKKLAIIRKALRPLKRVDISGEGAREAVVQGVLSRGDRRLQESLSLRNRENVSWRGAFRQGGVNSAYYATRARDCDEMLPWDHLDLGVSREYLWREYERSLSSAATLPCNVGVCRRCGACKG